MKLISFLLTLSILSAEECLTYNLFGGYNLLSFPVLQESMTVEDVLNDMPCSGVFIELLEDGSEVELPPDEIIEYGKGYTIYTYGYEDCSYTLCGEPYNDFCFNYDIIAGEEYTNKYGIPLLPVTPYSTLSEFFGSYSEQIIGVLSGGMAALPFDEDWIGSLSWITYATGYYILGNEDFTMEICGAPYGTNSEDYLGDLDQDGDINILDIVTTVGIILEEMEPTSYQKWVADLNFDKIIDILDIIILVNLVLGG